MSQVWVRVCDLVNCCQDDLWPKKRVWDPSRDTRSTSNSWPFLGARLALPPAFCLRWLGWRKQTRTVTVTHIYHTHTHIHLFSQSPNTPTQPHTCTVDMEDSSDWVIDCSDDELYSEWQTVVQSDGKQTKRPKEHKIVQLYKQLDSGQLPHQLSWKRQLIHLESQNPLPSLPEPPVQETTKDANPGLDARSSYGFDEDYSDGQLDILRSRFYSRKDRPVTKGQVTFNNILQDLSKNKKKKWLVSTTQFGSRHIDWLVQRKKNIHHQNYRGRLG